MVPFDGCGLGWWWWWSKWDEEGETKERLEVGVGVGKRGGHGEGALLKLPSPSRCLLVKLLLLNCCSNWGQTSVDASSLLQVGGITMELGVRLVRA